MDRVSFDDCLLRYGPDLERWPEPQRSAAYAFVGGDAAAAARLDRDVALGDLIRRASAVAPASDAALVGAVLAKAAAPRRRGALSTSGFAQFGPRFAVPAFAVFCLLFGGAGFAIGIAAQSETNDALMNVAEGDFMLMDGGALALEPGGNG
ncbi:hypothetical protein NPA31_018535 [Aurantimonas sp. MSK8Z-1]|uniref:hypothetical protein n=1 Tax=Mangrovibrevibacter kandeliae TaxID=2968473 RepID=UPI00211836F0|nr:hypothetical protein [Aurantimonas sp. MSK8Z-1]MCW4116960.1 hypothetical protein [Aurantimonas sp. MSK8Z-1]